MPLFLPGLKVDAVSQFLTHLKKHTVLKDQILSLGRFGKSVEEIGITIGLCILVAGTYKEFLLRLIY
jgi:hypothetical protein